MAWKVKLLNSFTCNSMKRIQNIENHYLWWESFAEKIQRTIYTIINRGIIERKRNSAEMEILSLKV